MLSAVSGCKLPFPDLPQLDTPGITSSPDSRENDKVPRVTKIFFVESGSPFLSVYGAPVEPHGNLIPECNIDCRPPFLQSRRDQRLFVSFSGAATGGIRSVIAASAQAQSTDLFGWDIGYILQISYLAERRLSSYLRIVLKQRT